MHGPCGKSLQETAAWAYASGVAEVCAQSLNERLHRAAAFLAALTDRLIAAREPGPALVWPGRYLRLVDGSSLSQPGSRGTDWRVHAVYDLGRGGFSHLSLTDKHGAESLLRAPPVPGEVAIADRLYAARGKWRPVSTHQAEWRGISSSAPAGTRWRCAVPMGRDLN